MKRILLRRGAAAVLLILPAALRLPAQDTAAPDSVAGRAGGNLFEKVIEYFAESNETRPDKKFDISFIGGPHYSKETNLAIGLMAAGIYRPYAGQPATKPSSVTLYSDLSVRGNALVGIRGYHNFPLDRYRLNYRLYIYNFPDRFWGIGYHNCSHSENRTKYEQFKNQVYADFMFRAGNLQFGPSAEFTYVRATKVVKFMLWENQPLEVRSYGTGLSLRYDSRDYVENATRGWYLALDQRFYPRFIGNDMAFSSSEITVSNYCRLWRGAVLASQFHSLITYGDTPWSMMATFGGSNAMRGYYEGRYNDKGEMDATLELRQKIHNRIGAVVWAGAGTIFHDVPSIEMRHVLPNWGIGYRWEFKKHINIRLDLGMGKHEEGFVFSINEAF